MKNIKQYKVCSNQLFNNLIHKTIITQNNITQI